MKKQAGFTLAELLIVVAIIAILVAIGIPAFSTAMERSRETVDLSNIRGAYAEFMVGMMGHTDLKEGYYDIDVKQRDVSKWVVDVSGFVSNISGDAMPTTGLETGKGVIVFTVNKNQKPSLKFEHGVTAASKASGACIESGDGYTLVSGS
ncbi:MAG: prepilin-type N-terminal cleavage/methylation domain-containing protein [Oscillibacter sp.]|nr:prepilin-type N-terminal cleavage/methylation domain-containing protein [Oscillibacter sp.]